MIVFTKDELIEFFNTMHKLNETVKDDASGYPAYADLVMELAKSVGAENVLNTFVGEFGWWF